MLGTLSFSTVGGTGLSVYHPYSITGNTTAITGNDDDNNFNLQVIIKYLNGVKLIDGGTDIQPITHNYQIYATVIMW